MEECKSVGEVPKSYWNHFLNGCFLVVRSAINLFPLSNGQPTCSLTAMKVLLGIVLLGKASEYQYVNPVSKSQSNMTEQITLVSESTHGRSRSSSLDLLETVSEPIMGRGQQETIRQLGKAKPRTTKTKSLSDVERFTLCSNRIV